MAIAGDLEVREDLTGATAERGWGILAVVLCIVPVTSQLFQATRPAFMSSWGITEWLISYDAGFVRRGLTGELVEAIAIALRIAPSLVIAALSAVLFAACLGLALVVSRRKLPLWLVLSPAAFGMPMAAGFIVRKDLLIVLLFAISLAGLHRPASQWARLALVNAISIVGVLSHEVYAFAALPLLALSAFPRQPPLRRITYGALSLAPAGAAALMAVIYKGTPQLGLALARHWNEVLERIAPSGCCFAGSESEFGALGWTAGQSHALAAKVASEVDGIFWSPLMWLLSLALAAFMLALFFRPRRAGGQKALLAIYSVQALFVAPVWYAANDFGRWIFLVSATTLIAASMWDNDDGAPAPLLAGCMPPLPDWQRAKRWLPPVVLLGFAVPACCWSVHNYLLTTLVGRNLDSLAKLAALLHPGIPPAS